MDWTNPKGSEEEKKKGRLFVNTWCDDKRMALVQPPISIKTCTFSALNITVAAGYRGDELIKTR